MIKLEDVDGELVDLGLFKFSGGEVHFKVSASPYFMPNPITITSDFKDPDDVMTLLLLSDYLGEKGLKVNLAMEYIPYSRQDRATSELEPFSLKTFARVINSCEFGKVVLFDPHSDVTPALLNNCFVVKRVDLIPVGILHNAIIVSPDAGAQKSNNEVSSSYGLEHIIATKERDVSTGAITATKVHTDIELKGRRLVICDDICDGGRTFIELAKVLREYEPESIHLYVTYGIFSKGLECVKEHFDSITSYFGDSNNED